MEINNTFTSLIADLPYPSNKNQSMQSKSDVKDEDAKKSVDRQTSQESTIELSSNEYNEDTTEYSKLNLLI